MPRLEVYHNWDNNKEIFFARSRRNLLMVEKVPLLTASFKIAHVSA
jgi:hypothetical protein